MGDRGDLIERRRRYIERQRTLNPGAFGDAPSGMAPQGHGPTNRHGMPRVPVGQRVASNWPVLDLGDVPTLDRDSWRLEITGLVDNPVTLDWVALQRLPQTADVSDFHCVTTCSRLDNRRNGPCRASMGARCA